MHTCFVSSGHYFKLLAQAMSFKQLTLCNQTLPHTTGNLLHYWGWHIPTPKMVKPNASWLFVSHLRSSTSHWVYHWTKHIVSCHVDVWHDSRLLHIMHYIQMSHDLILKTAAFVSLYMAWKIIGVEFVHNYCCHVKSFLILVTNAWLNFEKKIKNICQDKIHAPSHSLKGIGWSNKYTTAPVISY